MTWEYKTLSLPGAQERQSLLSEMGLNGWELVVFEQGLAYFKREKGHEVKPLEVTMTNSTPMAQSLKPRQLKR